mgnify:CR=1 FL=1
MELMCGIDEAGRGPVIGPLVVAGVVFEKEKLNILKNLGVKDSKLLSPAKREELAKKIFQLAYAWHIAIAKAKEIDDAVESKTTNLNFLEAEKIAYLINLLEPNTAFIDCPSPNKRAFQAFLQKQLKTKTKLVVAHHAERKYLIVAAASIIAKVIRDAEIEALKAKLGIDFGSGYAADPKTIDFLKRYWRNAEYEEIFRKSWEPYKKVKAMAAQAKIEDFEK